MWQDKTEKGKTTMDDEILDLMDKRRQYRKQKDIEYKKIQCENR